MDATLNVVANLFFFLIYEAEELCFISRDLIVLVSVDLCCMGGEVTGASVLVTLHRAFLSLFERGVHVNHVLIQQGFAGIQR